MVVFAIAIFLFMYLLVMQPHKIKGDSMQPNFPDGEYLLTDKVSYRLREPERGEIIVFKAPGSSGEEFIKRIIGLPGERVKVEKGKVFINGNVLSEAYIPDPVKTPSGAYLTEGKEVTIIPENYIVLGDNRVASSDSRTWGFVPKENMTGRAWLIYWPPNRIGFVSEPSYTVSASR